MTFLARIDTKTKQAQERYGEIRRILAEAVLPGPTDFGLSCAIKLPRDVHDRLEEVCSRHGLKSLKEAAFKAMMLGLATMERLPAAGQKQQIQSPMKSARVVGRVLSDVEVSRLKDEGFSAPRVKPPEKHYYDDDEPVRAVG